MCLPNLLCRLSLSLPGHRQPGTALRHACTFNCTSTIKETHHSEQDLLRQQDPNRLGRCVGRIQARHSSATSVPPMQHSRQCSTPAASRVQTYCCTHTHIMTAHPGLNIQALLFEALVSRLHWLPHATSSRLLDCKNHSRAPVSTNQQLTITKTRLTRTGMSWWNDIALALWMHSSLERNLDLSSVNRTSRHLCTKRQAWSWIPPAPLARLTVPTGRLGRVLTGSSSKRRCSPRRRRTEILCRMWR